MKKIIELLLAFILLVVLVCVGWPKLSVFLNNKGTDCYNRKLYGEAISYFKKSLAIKPSSAAYYNLANAYRELEDEDAAIKEYRNSIQTKPDDAGVYLALSRIYLNRQMYKEALSLIERAETEFPAEPAIKEIRKEIFSEHVMNCVEKGVEAYSAGDKTEAYSLLNKALKINPNYVQAYYFLGYFYVADNNYSQAEELLKKALRIKPDFLLANILLGDLYYKKGDYEKAISVYKAGLLIDFNNSYLHNSLGLSFMNIEHYREAIAHLKKALDISPDNLSFRYSLASLYRDEGLLEEAILEYRKILKYLPGYLYIHNDLGDIYTQQGRKEEARREYSLEIEACREKLKFSPDDINILNSIAYAYSSVGKDSRAKDIIKDIIKHHPSWRQAYLTLSRVEENIGDKEKAIAALEKAKSLSAHTGFIDKDITRLKRMAYLPPEKNVFFDKIYLKNGRTVEGVILEETDKKIVLEIYAGESSGRTTISRDRVRKISKIKNIKK